MVYWIGKADERSLREAEFAHALRRRAGERIGRGLVHTHKPGIDDISYRIFDTMRDYSTWCEQLPSWLGYAHAK